MFRRKQRGVSRDGSGHTDRPWVYFMIDSFFLVTQFFVLTFQIKTADDLILPNRLPVGGDGPHGLVVPVTALSVRISRARPQSEARYSINGGESVSLAGVSDTFGELAGGRSPDKFQVRVSYGDRVNFGDVLPIFNTCSKLKIKQCGLQPTRGRVFN